MTPGMTGNIDWSQTQQAPTPTPQTLQSQFMNMGGEMLGPGSGVSGSAGMGMGMGDSGVGQENSDEYWNALIDGQSNSKVPCKFRGGADVAGILGTTGTTNNAVG